MRITEQKLRSIIRQELGESRRITEELSDDEEKQVRRLIRKELSEVFYDLFKRRGFWVDRV